MNSLRTYALNNAMVTKKKKIHRKGREIYIEKVCLWSSMREGQDPVTCKVAGDKGLQNHGELKQGDYSYLLGGRSELWAKDFKEQGDILLHIVPS